MNNYFVLTAAHCKADNEDMKLRIGIHDVAGSDIKGKVEEDKISNNQDVQNFDIKSQNFVIHENYTVKEKVARNDIALIKLPRPAQMNGLTQPACWKNQNSINGKPVVVGWGKTDASQINKTINGLYTNKQYKLEVN